MVTMTTSVGVLFPCFSKMADRSGPRGVSPVGRNDLRLPCSICCRKFAPDVLDRHETICQKTAQKKRKTFDSAKQRILGTDIPTVQSAPAQLQSSPAAPFRRSGGKNSKSPATKTRPRLYIGGLGDNNNKEMQQVRGQGGPTSFMNRRNAGLVQCPSCDRNFSDKAADRHIPWCKELRSRIPRSPPCTVAKHRLETRIQYKAPMPGKRRNSPPRSPTKGSIHNIPFMDSTNANRLPPSPVGSHVGVNVTGTAIHARQRRGNANHVNALMKLPAKDHRIVPSSSNQGSLSNLSSNNGHGSSDGMIHSSSWEYFEDTPIVGRQVAKQKSKKEPKLGKHADSYDPFESAQRQMEELLLSTSPPSSPILAAKSMSSSVGKLNRSSTSTDREQPIHSNDSSAWSLDSDKDLEDIEEDIVVFDDPIFEEIIAMQAAPSPQLGRSTSTSSNKHSRYPRRTVSREEALFGSNKTNIDPTGSLDSDYGSLLRRSPSTPVRLSIDPGSLIIGTNSRSSSETSLPPLISSDVINSGKLSSMKMSRFCHECGAKYPVDHAKFCCECGIMRLRV